MILLLVALIVIAVLGLLATGLESSGVFRLSQRAFDAICLAIVAIVAIALFYVNRIMP